jgi:isoleucyl-tRNA synthetase
MDIISLDLQSARSGLRTDMFGESAAEVSLAQIEEEMRRFWRRYGVPQAVRAACDGGLPYVIYQQPLMAVGQSWADQVRLLAFADLMARYHAMRGDAVYNQVGWAGHGLPIEIAVERSLVPDQDGYELAQFNAACLALVLEGMEQGEALIERLAIWLGPGDSYATPMASAVGVVWQALWQLWNAGRLRHERCVAPVCPRCATPLSAAEAACLAAEVQASSIWLRLPWEAEPNAYLLAWTPSPWMLVGMVALAAHPDASYALVELVGRTEGPPTRLLVAETALEHTLPGDYRLIRRLNGRALAGSSYRPPYTFLPADEGTHRVVLSESVSLERGTGLLPVTPAFDAASLQVAEAYGLPVPHLLDAWGNLDDTVRPWHGLGPLDAELPIIDNLRERGLLYREQPGTRSSARCPYCETPLLPLAWPVWLADTASGPWIVGRERAWGVPLPVWACGACGHELCVAGLDELAQRAGTNADQIDPHRPAVDRLTFPCQACGGTMRRVPEVIDPAFEAAVLPLALAPQPGPAHLAVGLGEKYLGWLSDITEVAALLHGALAWEQAIALPESEAERETHPSRSFSGDAMRWAAYTQTTPDQAEGEFLRPLWQLAAGRATAERATREGRPYDERWGMARLQQAVRALTEALDAGEARRAAEELAALVRDLVGSRISQRPGGGGEVLESLSWLLAPFVPHLAEAIHRQVAGLAAESVHLAAWPIPNPAWEDPAVYGL